VKNDDPETKLNFIVSARQMVVFYGLLLIFKDPNLCILLYRKSIETKHSSFTCVQPIVSLFWSSTAHCVTQGETGALQPYMYILHIVLVESDEVRV